jgi:hypothetical protein
LISNYTVHQYFSCICKTQNSQLSKYRNRKKFSAVWRVKPGILWMSDRAGQQKNDISRTRCFSTKNWTKWIYFFTLPTQFCLLVPIKLKLNRLVL